MITHHRSLISISRSECSDYKPNGREQLRLAVATTTMSLGTGVMLSLPHDDDVKITENQKADATAADAAETVAAEKVKAEAATVAVKKAARYLCQDPRGR